MKLKYANLLKKSGFYLLGNIFSKAFSFLMIPILTRLLTTREYGLANTYLTYVTFCTLVFGLCLDFPIRSAYVDFADDMDDFIKALFLLKLFSFTAGGLAVFLAARAFGPSMAAAPVFYCFLQSFMDSTVNMSLMKWMMNGNYIKRTLCSAAPNVITLLLSIVLILSLDTHKEYGRILAGVLTSTATGAYLSVKILKEGKLRHVKKYWKYALPISIPLIFHGIGNIVIGQSDRIMLTYLRNASETGIYSLAYSFSTISIAVTATMESIWIPWFTRQMKEENTELIRKYMNLYMGGIIFLNGSLLLVSREVFRLLAPASYQGGNRLIFPLIIATVLQSLYGFYVNIEYYYKNTKMMAKATFAGAAVNIVLNVVFIPQYGSLAAMYSTFFSYLLMFIFHYKEAAKITRNCFSIKFYRRNIYRLLLICLFYFLTYRQPVLRWSGVFIIAGQYLFQVNQTMAFLKPGRRGK